MSTQTAEKIYKELRELKKETKDLRELFFLVLRDPEGEYKNTFIKRILRKSRLSPKFSFTDKKNFLGKISS
jgi:hypothetical protein